MEQIIENALEKMVSGVRLPDGTTSDQVSAAITKIMRARPEIFWFDGVYNYDPATALLELNYPFGVAERDGLRHKINLAVRCCFQPDNLAEFSDLEKVTYVYWWLSWRCQYFDYARHPNSIVGVFLDGKACGEGFAKAAQLLLGLLGIRCELVYGRFREQFTYEHLCWNRVYIDGVPFNLDVSCADYTRGCFYHPPEGYHIISRRLWNFFCKSDADIAYNRVIDPDCCTCRCRHSLKLDNVDVSTLYDINPYGPVVTSRKSVARVDIDAEIVEVEPDNAPEISENRSAPTCFIPAWSVKVKRLRRKPKLKVRYHTGPKKLLQYHVPAQPPVSPCCRGAPLAPAIDSG